MIENELFVAINKLAEHIYKKNTYSSKSSVINTYELKLKIKKKLRKKLEFKLP